MKCMKTKDELEHVNQSKFQYNLILKRSYLITKLSDKSIHGEIISGNKRTKYCFFLPP